MISADALIKKMLAGVASAQQAATEPNASTPSRGSKRKLQDMDASAESGEILLSSSDDEGQSAEPSKTKRKRDEEIIMEIENGTEDVEELKNEGACTDSCGLNTESGSQVSENDIENIIRQVLDRIYKNR